MRLTSIAVTDFLALPSLSFELDTTLTVITGANGVGKSTLLAACTLAKQAVACAVNGDVEPLELQWSAACHDGGSGVQAFVR
ncbi:AAA family ATPase [Kribbella sp. NPDC058245]|uniref:AAA family ATPase n=1 Tax=Kribbella sp. NPDC058245 TaxID=3346399 RepID=UPI0036EAD8B7